MCVNVHVCIYVYTLPHPIHPNITRPICINKKKLMFRSLFSYPSSTLKIIAFYALLKIVQFSTIWCTCWKFSENQDHGSILHTWVRRRYVDQGLMVWWIINLSNQLGHFMIDLHLTISPATTSVPRQDTTSHNTCMHTQTCGYIWIFVCISTIYLCCPNHMFWSTLL